MKPRTKMRSIWMDFCVGDGGAHEASLVLFLPEVLDASGVTPKRSLLSRQSAQ